MFYLITNVFPYSGFMALHLLNGNSETLGGEESRQKMVYVAANIGPYAGLLASSFRLGRVPTAIPWGRCADVYGRKFALAVGTAAMVVGHLLFGLAPTFAAAVGIRFCTGLMNGTMVVARTAISEIAEGDPDLESLGVAMISSMSGYGMLIGPAIGGLLSDPIKQYPGFFQTTADGDADGLRSMAKRIFEDYPFLLPNLVGSVVAFLSLVTVLFCVEETLPDDMRRDWRLVPLDIGSWILSRTILRRRLRTASTRNNSDGRDGESETQAPSPGTVSISENTPLMPPTQERSTAATEFASALVTPSGSDIRNESDTNRESSTTQSVFASFLEDRNSNLRRFFYSMWSYAFTSLASLETFPLFAIASTTRGGLGLDEISIGFVQTIAGVIFVLGQYKCFTLARKRFGLMKSLRISALTRSLLLLLFPMALYISPEPNGNRSNWYQFGFLGLVTGVIGILGSIFMGCATIGVNGCIKDVSQRASMNGLQSSIASIGRGLGPIFSGYLVATTMTSGMIPARFSAWVVYGVLMVIEGITYLSALMIPDQSRDANDDDSGSCNTSNDDEEDVHEKLPK